MHRLFVALRPPPEVRAGLAAIQSGVPGARWQDDDQLHLTLRYIGEVDRPVAEDVAAVLGQVRAAAPVVAIAGVGRFEKHGLADALWAGVAPHDALAALHKKVDAALVRIGLAPEGRAYLPHVTLARLARSYGGSIEIEHWLAAHAGLTSAPFTLGHMILFESRLGSEGARYDAVMRWPLDG